MSAASSPRCSCRSLGYISCAPVIEYVDALPVPQAALGAAFGLASGSGEDRFLVAVRTLTLLAEVAGDTGLLCLVDDARWLDPASADALTFAARRIQAENIVMLFAAREGGQQLFEAAGLPDLYLAGLDRAAAQDFLDELVPDVNAQVRDRLITLAGGNPLALAELSRVLNTDALAGREQLPDRLPVGKAIERAFVARAHALPDSARTLLLLAAADATGDLVTLLRAAGQATDVLRDIESSALASIVGSSLRFRHPLVRSAIYQGHVRRAAGRPSCPGGGLGRGRSRSSTIVAHGTACRCGHAGQ